MKTGITLPNECPRERTNCNPYAQIISSDGESFICCGCYDGSIATVLQKGIIASGKARVWTNNDDPHEKDVAKIAYIIADAMIAEREARHKDGPKENKQDV